MRQVKSSDEAVYTIRVKRDQLDRLHEIAAGERRTLAQQIRVMFDRVIAEHEKQAA